MIRFNIRKEPNVLAWIFRLLLGPAAIADGVVATVTLGFVSTLFTLNVARKLAKIRAMAR